MATRNRRRRNVSSRRLLERWEYTKLSQEIPRVPIDTVANDATILELSYGATVCNGSSICRSNTHQVAAMSASRGPSRYDVVTDRKHLIDVEVQVRKGRDVNNEELPRRIPSAQRLLWSRRSPKRKWLDSSRPRRCPCPTAPSSGRWH